MPLVTVTRRLHFNAAHRVHNPALSDEENTRLFGKCNNPNWHGHNYILDVSVRGPVDDRTGYVLDLSALKKIVEERAVNLIDHKNFNLDVPFMRDVIPTSENIIVGIWRQLEPVIRPGELVKLVLWETPNNYVEYTGE
ncbi:MAG TPA: 6-carboxytetrahydropterin synthase [Gemmatimonadaceae bacterium]|nr:6-carboxytetrahydropterin synthase [Gemmatimonadaceae bacterium]